MNPIIALIAGIIGVIAGILLIVSDVGLFFTLALIIALAGGIIAVAIGNRAWNKNKDKVGLVGAILGLITWGIVLIAVFTKFIF